LDPKDVTRYIRPQDIPALDKKIIDPIVKNAAKEMADAHPGTEAAAWESDIMQALLSGEVLIVIDDLHKRVGLVRSDRPPFLGLSGQSD